MGVSTKKGIDLTKSTLIDISQVNNAKYIGKNIEVEVLIDEIEAVPFIGYESINMTCKPAPETRACKSCKYLESNCAERKITPFDSDFLEFVDSASKTLGTVFKKALGIPKECVGSKFDQFVKKVSLTRCTAIQSVSYSSNLKDEGDIADSMYSSMIKVVLIGSHKMEENKAYYLVGVPHRDPKTGRCVLLVHEVSPVIDDFETFTIIDEVHNDLRRFQPEDWTAEASAAKCKEVMKEHRINHHLIRGREDMEYFSRITFHSPIGYTWRDSIQNRGLFELAIIGDTRNGKSEIVDRLVDVNGVGYKFAAPSVTMPGVLGGMSPNAFSGGSYQLKWGMLVRQDRGLVYFDECHDSQFIEMIPKLNDLRSSGIASVDKVGVSRKAFARNRKFFLANCPHGTTTDDYTNGIEVLRKIFTTPESIARLDMCLVTATRDVEASVIGRHEPKIPSYYDPFLSQHLIKFIYSRSPNQVIFEDGMEDYIMEISDRLCRKYDCSKIPLIEPGEAHHKIARGSSSHASSEYSVDDTRQKIIVRQCHIDTYVSAMEANYDSDTNGYYNYSKHIRARDNFTDFRDFYTMATKIREMFGPRHKPLLNYIFQEETCSLKSLEKWDSVDPTKINKIYTYLLSNGLIVATSKGYNFRKKRKGIMLFRYLLGLGDFGIMINEDSCRKYFARAIR